MAGSDHTTLLFSLGDFLRRRRSLIRPHPSAKGQRRTPGLRREEVATRAGVSVTWYTWLEQGRGGSPSDHVLERLSDALELGAAEREVLFLLAQNRPPPIRISPPSPVGPALQRVLDAIPAGLAYVKTLTWDIVAWNSVAAQFTDIASVASEDRNVLRRLFKGSEARGRFLDWEEEARFCLGAFRMDLARAGGNAAAAALIAELQATSDDFRRLWADNTIHPADVHLRRLQHPKIGAVTLECSSFPIYTGSLSLLVHTPATADDAAKISLLMDRG